MAAAAMASQVIGRREQLLWVVAPIVLSLAVKLTDARSAGCCTSVVHPPIETYSDIEAYASEPAIAMGNDRPIVINFGVPVPSLMEDS